MVFTYDRKRLEEGLVDNNGDNAEVERKYSKELTTRDYKAVAEKSMIVIVCGLMLTLMLMLIFIFIISIFSELETSLVSNLLVDMLTESYNTDLVNVESGVSNNENLYPSKNMERYMSLDKRGWGQDAVDGAITMFASVSANVFSTLIVSCTPSFLDYFGIVVPQAMVLRISVCAWSLGIAALVSYVGLLMQAHRANGGWQFDNGSGSANDKRFIGAFEEVFGTAGVFPLFDDMFIVNGMPIGSNHFNKRDEYLDHGIDVKSLIHMNDTEMVHMAYTFYIELHDHNKSVVAEINALEDAIETWKRCGTSDYCRSSRNVWLDANSTSLHKRDGGDWASYNDWGFNGGYVNDWWLWDEFKHGAQAMQSDNSNVEHVQSCTNDARCYAAASKYCLAGGMSSNRKQDSAWVGEVYLNAYGVIDGECFNG